MGPHCLKCSAWNLSGGREHAQTHTHRDEHTHTKLMDFLYPGQYKPSSVLAEPRCLLCRGCRFGQRTQRGLKYSSVSLWVSRTFHEVMWGLGQNSHIGLAFLPSSVVGYCYGSGYQWSGMQSAKCTHTMHTRDSWQCAFPHSRDAHRCKRKRTEAFVWRGGGPEAVATSQRPAPMNLREASSQVKPCLCTQCVASQIIES